MPAYRKLSQRDGDFQRQCRVANRFASRVWPKSTDACTIKTISKHECKCGMAAGLPEIRPISELARDGRARRACGARSVPAARSHMPECSVLQVPPQCLQNRVETVTASLRDALARVHARARMPSLLIGDWRKNAGQSESDARRSSPAGLSQVAERIRAAVRQLARPLRVRLWTAHDLDSAGTTARQNIPRLSA